MKSRSYIELTVCMAILYLGSGLSLSLGTLVVVGYSLSDGEVRGDPFYWSCVWFGNGIALLAVAGLIRLVMDVAGDIKHLRDSSSADVEAAEFRAMLNTPPIAPPVVKR